MRHGFKAPVEFLPKPPFFSAFHEKKRYNIEKDYFVVRWMKGEALPGNTDDYSNQESDK